MQGVQTVLSSKLTRWISRKFPPIIVKLKLLYAGVNSYIYQKNIEELKKFEKDASKNVNS